MIEEFFIHFAPEIKVDVLSKDEAVLISPSKKFSWKEPSTALQNCIDQLTRGSTKEALCKEWTKKGKYELFYFFYFIEQLKAKHLICYSAVEESRPIATFFSYPSEQLLQERVSFNEDTQIHLSRFAYLRCEDGELLLESPLVSGRVIIKDNRALEVIHLLTSPKSAKRIAKETLGLTNEAVNHLLLLLHRSSFLAYDTEEMSLQTWEFHDLLFHARSRMGRTDKPYGGTFRFLEKMDPYPVLGNYSTNPMISLYKPDMGALIEQDWTLTDVLEERKSIRDHGNCPIDIKQLGEFLYRVARLKKVEKTEHYVTCKRPSPGGGGCHELEIYPLIHNCKGLEQGLYHYHPEKHVLDLVLSSDPRIDQLKLSAKQSSGSKELPQILIIIAARFGRISWKYESMAYSIILKNVGALLQTMYLVATAMGLAPCAIGGGNSDVFTNITQKNYYEETSVGEFILGTK